MKKFFTSESVTEGHPDKICDKVADSILDAVLTLDADARVACEVVATTDYMLIMGEISTFAKVDYSGIARQVIQDIGYTDPELGFCCDTVDIQVKVHTQSPDIAMGVDKVDAQLLGAGDQGMMFGYACSETEELMPLSISLAHALAKRLELVRKHKIVNYLRPDGKTQVTVEYKDNKPHRVDTVVVSAQHSPEASQDTLVGDIKQHVISHVLKDWVDNDTKILINTTGQFCIGGPDGDSGLTGRKIIADTYGGHCAHGGGAFSGKDSTKVDRSATYMARYICKNIVAAGIASRCEIQISYAIGVSQPTSIFCNTFGTGSINDQILADIVLKLFDLRPQAIIDKLGLCKPVFADTATYGHFGRANVSWEQLDKVEDLKAELSKIDLGQVYN
ncbi:MAG: methionine adenosyltransferase [Clostridiales bacterium]|jgi:S-adenosylmethionine synthetase|nr:methionine adenosyltransferase [Clostridiales bacterium]